MLAAVTDERSGFWGALYNRPDPRLGQVLAGRYRVVEALGCGAAATVYAVERVSDGARLAAKILRVEVSRVAEMRQRFEREAKAMALIDHPNIVQVLDFGILEDRTPFLIMELLEGRSLADALDAGPLDAAHTIEIGRQILDALAYIHEAGVIHRDLKPDNVFVVDGESGEVVKLVDFGIVKVMGEVAANIGGPQISRAGIAFGTPDYMSPEQATSQAIDVRSDLYAAGVVLFEMLTGRCPFESDDPMRLLGMQVAHPPPTLAEASGRAHPDALEAICARALEKRPDDRFASAREMRDALEAAGKPPVEPEPEHPVAPSTPAPAAIDPARAGRIIAVVVGLLLAALVLAAALD
jgi:serine/threonine-protein kinase